MFFAYHNSFIEYSIFSFKLRILKPKIDFKFSLLPLTISYYIYLLYYPNLDNKTFPNVEFTYINIYDDPTIYIIFLKVQEFVKKHRFMMFYVWLLGFVIEFISEITFCSNIYLWIDIFTLCFMILIFLRGSYSDLYTHFSHAEINTKHKYIYISIINSFKDYLLLNWPLPLA